MTKSSSKLCKNNSCNNTKEIINLDTKHRLMINSLSEDKKKKDLINDEINNIKFKINNIILNNLNDIKIRANLLDNLQDLEIQYNKINNNTELEYYNNIGDLIMNYYEIKNCSNLNSEVREKKDILEFLSNSDKVPSESINNEFTAYLKFYNKDSLCGIDSFIYTIKEFNSPESVLVNKHVADSILKGCYVPKNKFEERILQRFNIYYVLSSKIFNNKNLEVKVFQN